MNESPCILYLGRYGDILNILPLAQLLNGEGKRPTLLVSHRFAGLKDAVSYADFDLFPGEYTDVRCAREYAHSKYRTVIVPQVYGDDISFTPRCDNFCEEAYSRAGFSRQFNEGCFDSIAIDRRYPDDEAELAELVKLDTSKPVVLVNVSGHSSPFSQADVLLSNLRLFNVVDISNVRASRLTDLLGLFDRAALLVTTDTATLHLAGAHGTIPYIALVNDQHSMWHGAYTRGNCIARIRYKQFNAWRPHLIDLIRRVEAGATPKASLIHVYAAHASKNPDTRRRDRLAQTTWRMAYAQWGWRGCPVPDYILPRLWADGEKRRLPYIRDLFDIAAAQCEPGQLIVLTNTDTCFSPELTAQLHALSLSGRPAYACRRDFKRICDMLPPGEIQRGDSYVGKDLFAFSAAFWKSIRRELPDLLVGGEAWDCILAEILKKHNAEVWRDSIYHERHESVWETVKNRYTLPSQLYCRRLARAKLLELGVDPRAHGL